MNTGVWTRNKQTSSRTGIENTSRVDIIDTAKLFARHSFVRLFSVFFSQTFDVCARRRRSYFIRSPGSPVRNPFVFLTFPPPPPKFPSTHAANGTGNRTAGTIAKMIGTGSGRARGSARVHFT